MIRIGTYPLRGEGSAEERLRMIKDVGFDFVCLGMKSMFDGSGFTPEMCARVGIGVENVHLVCNGTTKIWSDCEEGEHIADSYCEQIQKASEYGLKIGITHVTWGVKTIPEAPNDLGMSRFYRIAECAEKYGFRLAIENSAFPEHLYRVLDSITGPVFGHCFDSGHQNAFAPDHDFLGKYGDRLIATHLHDNDGEHDLHIIPFDGTIKWDEVTKKLAKTPLARNMITSEFGSAHVTKFPGKSAAELCEYASRLSIADSEFVSVADGEIGFYLNMPFEDMLVRIYSAMARIADMIETAAKTNTD